MFCNFYCIDNRYIVYSYRIERALKIDGSQNINAKMEHLISKKIVSAINIHRQAIMFVLLHFKSFTCMFFIKQNKIHIKVMKLAPSTKLYILIILFHHLYLILLICNNLICNFSKFIKGMQNAIKQYAKTFNLIYFIY